MYAPTSTLFPVSFFSSAIWLNEPTPVDETTKPLRSAVTASESGAIEAPPALCALNSTSSPLKVVGLSSTLAPFDNLHSRIPVAGSVVSLTTRPGRRQLWNERRVGNGIDVGGERRPLRAVEDGENRTVVRHDHIRPLRSRNQHHAIPVGERAAAERIHLGERDGGKQSLRERADTARCR